MRRELTDKEIQDKYLDWLKEKTFKLQTEQLKDYGELIPVDPMSKGTYSWPAANHFKFVFDKAEYIVGLEDLKFFDGHWLQWSHIMLDVEDGNLAFSMMLVDWAETEE